MTGVDPKGLSQAAFEDKIEAIAHRWAIASYNKALGRTFEDIDAIKVELRRAITPLKGTPVATVHAFESSTCNGRKMGTIRNWDSFIRSLPIGDHPLFASPPLPETEEKAP